MFTQDEAELYDRQIRLWGVNAQSRIRQSKVLMLGFNGVASEVAKILVLAGIDTLTIVDNQTLQGSDLASNLFCRPSEQGQDKQLRTHAVKAKLKTLNPLVKVDIENSPITTRQAADYKGYDLVTLHSFLPLDDINAINAICREINIKFYIVIDYGFFGFMFSDLGSSFNFTYEEFNTLSNTESNNQSGVLSDPISLDDEDPADDPDDVETGASDEEDTRPKKKRRLHSPGRQPTHKIENEKLTKIGLLPYVSFQQMISPSEHDFKKQTSPIVLVTIAMFQFYNRYKHLPRHNFPEHQQQDVDRLTEIFESLRTSLCIPHDSLYKQLDVEWYHNIYGSLSPICAVLGGVAGQDMIRALSNKDIPIHNTFAFDGISMNGSVGRIGIRFTNSFPEAKPVVRDFLVIDDDD